MQLIFQRSPNPWEGVGVLLEDKDGNLQSIACINGNVGSYSGPVLVSRLDMDVVYGLGHPGVIHRILSEGPQPLLIGKDTGHRLFEHGLKAAWGKVDIRHSRFQTTLESFYRVENNVGRWRLLLAENRTLGFLYEHEDFEPVALLNRGEKKPLGLQAAVYCFEDFGNTKKHLLHPRRENS